MASSLQQTSSLDPNTTTSSSSAATITATTATTTPSKKKFGKNLNKLTKPPTPPAANDTSKSNAASRNGLLLLSTNKRITGSGPAKKNGLLASKPSKSTAPLPSLGLRYESSASTHDVLLGAVVGAAARAEQTPDAWGVAAAANNNGTCARITEDAALSTKTEAPVLPKTTQEAAPETIKETALRTVSPPHPDNYTTNSNLITSSNWDEYGGRDTKPKPGGTNRGLINIEDRPPHDDNQQCHHESEDVQQIYMSKLARERADRRRQEEASLVKEQKEKAFQRLRALESKMEANDATRSSNVTLETLGGCGNDNDTSPPTAATGRPSTQRTLYDPDSGRTYSSLVGAGADGKTKVGGASAGSRDDQPQRRGNSDVLPRGSALHNGSGPMIHLNSYEDRDRAEDPRTAAPRMLFDPKSGSMVAVSSRDDSKKGRKEKVRGRGRGKSVDNCDATNSNTKGNDKNSKANKNDKKDRNSGKVGKNAKVSAHQSSSSRNVVNPNRKLPRTRGVLYARDDKGNCYCADGCDGDLGYGAHSVEGGRVRNPESYDKFTEQQQQSHEDQTASAEEIDDGFEHYQRDEHNPYLATTAAEEMEMYDSYVDQHGYVEEIAYTPVQLDWVKPNEKIELLTGMDDESPTLQATAREWAPSHAALTRAQQAAVLPSLGSQDEDDSTVGVPTQTTLDQRRDNPANSNVMMPSNIRDDDNGEDQDDDHNGSPVRKIFLAYLLLLRQEGFV